MNQVWRIALRSATAFVLCAVFPLAAWAVPLDPIVPPDAASEGNATAPKANSNHPGAVEGANVPAMTPNASAKPEGISGQPAGAPAETIQTGEPLASAGGEPMFSTGPPIPPGFAWPTVLSTRNWFNVQDWYSEFDAQALDHTRELRHTPLLVDTNSGRVFDREDLNLGLAAGAHITLGTYLGEDYLKKDHSLEFTYQGLESWDGHFTLIGSTPSVLDSGTTAGNFGSLIGLLNFPNAVFFNGADFFKVEYHSEFNSFETNVRVKTHYLEDQLVYDPDDGRWNRHINSAATFSYLFGLRYVNIDERVNFTSGLNSTTGTIDGFPVSNFGGRYDNRVDNNLIGGQAGIELDYQYERWSVGIRGKTAVCLNFAEDQVNVMFNDPANPDEHFSKAKVGPAAVSEVNLTAGYQISPQARLRVTYDFEFLTSVGLGPNQLDLAGPHGPAALVNSNGLFLNGLSMGLDYIW